MRFPTTLALLLSWALTSLAPVSADETHVVLKIERGERLEYRVVGADEADTVKEEIEQTYREDHDAWRRDRSGEQPARPRIRNLSGRFTTSQEAETAWRADADRSGSFDCWRCQGQGKVAPQSGAAPGLGAAGRSAGRRGPTEERCDVCRGRKRIRAQGYDLLRISYGGQWTFRLLRRSMLSVLKDSIQNARGLLAGTGQRPPTTRTERSFRPGEFDEAQAAYRAAVEGARGESGFVENPNVPGLSIPEATWPDRFYTR